MESERRLEAFPQSEMKERAAIQAGVIMALLVPVLQTDEWNDRFRQMAEAFAQWWSETLPKDRSVTSAIEFVNAAKVSSILSSNGR